MAIIYGRPGAEIQLLRGCPSRINCFSDIKTQLEKHQKQLKEEKKHFFDKLPETIRNEKIEVDNLKIIRNDVEKKWDETIDAIQKFFESNKWMFWKYLNLVIKKKFSKPKAIRNADRNIQQQMSIINALEVDPEGVFSKEKNELISNINRLDGLTKCPEYWGAYGEIKVLQELKKLDDRYHILCNVDIQLRDYVRYRGERNLRSVQMDFVVVGPTGIYVLEAKNWSSDRVNHHTGLNPHEQVDRAGMVLWIYLKGHSFFYKPRVTNLLVPVQGNLGYNPNYRSVLIRNPYGLVKFINENRHDILDEKRIFKVVKILQR
jgi:hypothetical protein